jgi:hypothetical protein
MQISKKKKIINVFGKYVLYVKTEFVLAVFIIKYVNIFFLNGKTEEQVNKHRRSVCS